MEFIAVWPYGLFSSSLSARTALSVYTTAYVPGRQHWSSALAVKLAERISATIGQENGQENNRRNVEQF